MTQFNQHRTLDTYWHRGETTAPQQIINSLLPLMIGKDYHLSRGIVISSNGLVRRRLSLSENLSENTELLMRLKLSQIGVSV